MSAPVFLEGSSGVFKSAICGPAQAHWGSHWNGRTFPANWSSTANALEKTAFIAKDVMLVVDDFAPKGTGYDMQREHAKADQLLRAQGNLGGRSRMNADGTLRPTYFPRCLIVATGEDVPIGHSLRARMNIVPVAKGDIEPHMLLASAAGLRGQGRACRGYGGVRSIRGGKSQWPSSHLGRANAAVARRGKRWGPRPQSGQFREPRC